MRRRAIGITTLGNAGPSRAPTRSSNRSTGDRKAGNSASATSDANCRADTAGSSGRTTRSTNLIAKAVPGLSLTTSANRLAVECARLDSDVLAASSQHSTRSTASTASNSGSFG